MSLRYPALLLTATLLLSGCSTVKSLFSGKNRKEKASVETAAQQPGKPATQDNRQSENPEDGLTGTGKGVDASVPELPEITVSKNRPTITFGETESANVRIPLRYNDPFPESGELVLPLGELKDEFCYPYDGKVISPFGSRGRSFHSGMDIKAIPNDTIRAALPGVVRMSKYYSGYGNIVVVRHYNGIETAYSHQSRNLVSVNDVVEAGSPIGLAGRTGRATTEHVHFEVRIAGEPVNPTLLVDPDSRALRSDRTLYCYNRGGKVRVTTQPVVGYAPNEDSQNMAENKLSESSSPVSAKPASANSDGSSTQGTSQYYYVKKGDTLSRIALNNSTTVAKLCALNGIKPTSILQIKQKLKVK